MNYERILDQLEAAMDAAQHGIGIYDEQLRKTPFSIPISFSVNEWRLEVKGQRWKTVQYLEKLTALYLKIVRYQRGKQKKDDWNAALDWAIENAEIDTSEYTNYDLEYCRTITYTESSINKASILKGKR